MGGGAKNTDLLFSGKKYQQWYNVVLIVYYNSLFFSKFLNSAITITMITITMITITMITITMTITSGSNIFIINKYINISISININIAIFDTDSLLSC